MAFGKKNSAASARMERLTQNMGQANADSDSASSCDVPEPDLETIRRLRLNETSEERRVRLRVKTINFASTLTARAVIIFIALFYLVHRYSHSGILDRRIAIVIFAMVGDYGRVLMKAFTPGTK